MNNVIAFPQHVAPAPVKASSKRSMTLFLHVKCATLIVHLADTSIPEIQSGRVVES